MKNDSIQENMDGYELLEHHTLSITQFAHACNVSETWVTDHVRSGVVPLTEQLAPENSDVRAWRFPGHGIMRTRRIADLERIFDADPQLAAMTADLLEEVQQLRTLLRILR
ncbi:MAG: MerR family transcriptional regulator [Lautropia sp.]|nr:MerR family transcriptional regulator [Lautropia sp.]